MTAPHRMRLDEHWLRVGRLLVPADERREWLRAWQAELWYGHSRGSRQSLVTGLLRDALWLRTESWRNALSGTASLCTLLLAVLVGIAAIPLFVFAEDGRAVSTLLLDRLPRFGLASGLTLFVSFATSFTSFDLAAPASISRWFRARAFFLAKMVLLLLLTFLASTDLCLPLEARDSFAALPVQLLCFVVMALLGLRWNLLDGQHRCKHCLRLLAAPARVGRPSWNFLEYNGTELICRDGHGLLSVPEIETSWCRSSAWIPQRF